MVAPYLGLLGLLAAERLFELHLSRRHARWSFAQGGVEFGREHLLPMKLLHAGFLAACAAEVLLLDRPFHPALGFPMLGLLLAAQAVRYWAVASLGRHWNVRVIVIPGARAVGSGPYRYLKHPNYLAVVAELLAVPLIHSAWWTAVAFGAANAGMLAVRIRCENRALQLLAR